MGQVWKVIGFVLLIYKVVRLSGRAARLLAAGRSKPSPAPVAAPARKPLPRALAVILILAVVGPAGLALLAQSRTAPAELPAEATPVSAAVALNAPPELDFSGQPAVTPAVASTVDTREPVQDTRQALLKPLPPERPAFQEPAPPPLPEPIVARHTSVRMPIRRGRGGCGSRGGAGYRLVNGRCASRRR